MQITNLEAAVSFINAWKKEGMKIVATNGCFDILHAGHVMMLRDAKALGHILIVGINGDESIRQLKGPGRPVNPLQDRMEVINAIRYVDLVVPFQDKRATEFLRAVKPHIYVKACDYSIGTLDPEERAMLEAVEAEIMFVPMLAGRSTSSIIEKSLCTKPS